MKCPVTTQVCHVIKWDSYQLTPLSLLMEINEGPNSLVGSNFILGLSPSFPKIKKQTDGPNFIGFFFVNVISLVWKAQGFDQKKRKAWGLYFFFGQLKLQEPWTNDKKKSWTKKKKNFKNQNHPCDR